ncbi:hypothetical protein JCM3765_007811 [Sporobolomyces pararoseus]
MIVEHSQTLFPLYTPASPPDPFLPSNYLSFRRIEWAKLEGLNLSIGFDWREKKFRLTWDSDLIQFQPIKIRGGKIIVMDVAGKQKLWEIDLAASNFPFSPSATLLSPALQSSWISVLIKISLDIDKAVPPKAIDTIAAGITASLRIREPSNVCLYFPRTRSRLWTDEHTLRTASPYFETLLSSDFAESTPSRALDINAEDEKDQEPSPPSTYADSDTEEEYTTVSTPTKDGAAEAKSFECFPYKIIKIHDTAYSTYEAVLLWISARYINFAPLLSNFSLVRDQSVAKIKNSLSPGLPPPVSPKSVYRLAHLLEIPELKKLALANYSSQLSTTGALLELYGDVSCTYPEVQDIAMSFVVKHWDQIKLGLAMQKIRQKMENGEGNSAMALIGVKLATLLMETYKPK